ncbi:MAG: LamG-like jellyroll fold domain-containing protein, partial [Nanoarchaeota archaeon]|nr:LamG-like jellyroll fold domain-containing protein [Nanoarchaeota archaeon]
KIYILIQSDGTLWRWDGFNSGYLMPANEWHHVIYTFNAINDTNGTERFYVDGSLQTTRAGLVPSSNDQSILSIGSAAGSHPFNGTLDEMMIFNRSLSAEQIYAIWTNQTNVIAAQETNRGENWTVHATPNNGTGDGTVVISNNLTILNAKPVLSTLVLNTTNLAANDTMVNLTAYATTSDNDSDSVKVIYNWLRNGTSIAVLNMPFEGINGTTTNNAYDYSGNRNNGSDSVGVFWNATGGYDGKGAYLFNQTNTRIDIANSGSLNFTNASYSISFRVKRESVQNSGFGTIINKGGAGGLKIYILIQSDGTLWRWDGFNSGYGMPANEWHHIIYTFNAINDTNGTERFYVDGSLQATRAGLVPAANDQSILSIGSAAGSHPFNGTLDEMMIFNRSLSAEQIYAIWQNKTDTITANETTRGENWTVQATPNDGYEDGTVIISNNLTVRNTFPTTSTLVLNSTNISSNKTEVNLTAYATTSDADGDPIKVIYNWLRNGTSIAVLNMPFEGINGTTTNNAYDYSGNRNNGSDSVGVFWNATGGYDGKGAYLFNQTNTRIDIVNSGSLNFTGLSYSISFRVKREAVQNTGFGSIINKGGAGGQKIYILIQSVGTLSRWDTFNSGYLMPANEWHHVIYTFNAINDTNGTERFYVDGSLQATRAGLVPSSNDQSILSIGSAAGSHPFNGTLDEMMIFNRSLSAEQIFAIWQNKTDIIVANETVRGENWTVQATPNDGTYDGAMVISNNLTIRNTAPSAPILLNLTNDSTVTTRTPTLIWNVSDDDDGDISTYRIEIDDNILFNNLEVNVGGITNTSLTNVTYTLSTELSVDTSYFWRVFANDSSDGSGASAVRNFTVQSYLAINVTTDTVAFGTLSTGTNVSTPANAQPFRAENVGNIIANITVTGTSFFTFMHFPTTFYRFKIRANESGAFNVTASATEWNQTNTTLGANIFHVINLDWHSISNDFITDLNVSVPLNESPGSKSSTVTFTITG